MKNNHVSKSLPDLFGNLESDRSVRQKSSRAKRTGRSKRTELKKSKKRDWSVLDLFGSTSSLKTAAEQAEEDRARFLRIQGLADKTGLHLSTHANDSSVYLRHPLLAEKKVEAREYSLAIASHIGSDNGLIILPTGLGKTYVAANMMLSKLVEPSGKILFLAPTKPLVGQHVLTLRALFPMISIDGLTGHTPSRKRATLWEENRIIVATPQTISSELKRSENNPVGNSSDLVMIIVDEVHHQVGNYDYVSLAEYYRRKNSAIQFLGFTASPDIDIRQIKVWTSQLGVKSENIQARSFDSPDVVPYTFYRRIMPHYLDRKLTETQKDFKAVLIHNLTEVVAQISAKLTIDITPLLYLNDQDLVVGLKIRGFNELARQFVRGTAISEKRFKAYQLLTLYGLAMAYNSAIRSLNKGLAEFSHFLERQYDSFSKKGKRFQKIFCRNAKIQEIVKILYFNHLWHGDLPTVINWPDKAQDWYPLGWRMSLDDNKLPELRKILEEIPTGSQVIVFTNYRDTLKKVRYYLQETMPQKKFGIMTGTASKLNDPGMSHNDQSETLEYFRRGELDILISTSVGEEGLDFPAVDTVIFYEPIADIRRYIQRLGRTARHREGVVHIMIFRDTEEEIIFYMSRSREQKVEQIIKYLQNLNKA